MRRYIKFIFAACILLAALGLTSCEEHTHTLGEWEHGQSYHWQTCTDCGMKDNYRKHVYGDNNTTKLDCTVGSVCNVCGVDNADNANHLWDEGVVTKRPTPTEKGSITQTCTNCSEERTTDLDSVNLKLPTVPFEVKGTASSRFEIIEMIPAYDDTEEGGFLVTIRGTKTEDPNGYQNNTYCDVDWKLYDEDGMVATSGTFRSPMIIEGEVFESSFVIEVDTEKVYELVIIP